MQDYSLLFFSSMTRDGSLVFNLRPLITPTTEDRRIIEWNKIWRRATGKAISNRVERTRELQKSKIKNINNNTGHWVQYYDVSKLGKN